MQRAVPIRVQLGPFEFDMKAGELHRAGGKIRLQEQPLRILLMLVDRSGELVTREEIKKKLWPNDTVVEFDHGIHAAINRLRLALGDSADQPKYVETVGRRGYRLLVPVLCLESSSGDVVAPSSSDAGVMERLQPERASLIGKQVSHYRVLDVIGGGGMGMVYRAEDLKLGRRVALKFLPEELADDSLALQRFEREARTASSLNHPNICYIHEFGEHEGQPFIAMELLEGETLRDRLSAAAENGQRVPVDELLRIGLQVCEGLEAALERGIIHRDIKPANIFLTARGTVKILDFGLAKAFSDVESENSHPGNGSRDGAPMRDPSASLIEHTLTRTGAAMGTAGYMSPEQVRGEKLDSRTDLFSFGLVLYEMATSQRAFTGETAAMLKESILHRACTPVRELNAGVSPKLEHIIDKAIEKDREKRYQHATQLATDLKEVLPVQRVRHRLWIALGTAVLCLVVAAVFLLRPKEQSDLPPVILHQLTANSSENPLDIATISPDGKYLAYTDLRGSHIKELANGAIRDVPRPATENIPVTDWGGILWFPDSHNFFIGERNAQLRSVVWKSSLDGEAPHKIREDAVVSSVSPDGKSVAFTTARGKIGDRELWLMNVDGSGARKIHEVDENSNIGGPSYWLNDGTHLIFGSEHQGQTTAQGTYELLNLLNGTSKVILRSVPTWASQAIRNLGLLPDGRLVLLIGEQGVNGPSCNFWIGKLDPHTGELKGKPRQLTNWVGVCMDFLTTTADAKRLVFTKFSTEASVYVAQLRDLGRQIGQPRRLTLNDASETPVGWTTDGKAVLFESNVNGRLGLFRQRVDESAALVILPAIHSAPGAVMQETRAAPTISPDGHWLLYPVFPGEDSAGGTAELRRVAMTGGTEEVVLRAPLYDSPRCTTVRANLCMMAELSPDGKRLLFSELDAVHGRGKLLTAFTIGDASYTGNGPDTLSNSFVWALSPDGTRIAVVKRRENQIHLLSATGAPEQTIAVNGWERILGISWASDGQGWFVSSQGKSTSVLLRVNLSGEARVLWERNGDQGVIAVPSPDGRHIALGAFTTNDNAWMMENF